MGSQPHSVCLTLGTEGGQDQRLGPERPSLWHLEGSLEAWVAGLGWRRKGAARGSIWGLSPWELEPRPPGAKGHSRLGVRPARRCPEKGKGWHRSSGSMEGEKQRKRVEREGVERARQGGGKEKGAEKQPHAQPCGRKTEAEYSTACVMAWPQVCRKSTDFPVPSPASQRYVLLPHLRSTGQEPPELTSQWRWGENGPFHLP